MSTAVKSPRRNEPLAGTQGRQSAELGMPQVSPFILRGFRRYVRRYLRRHFSAVRLAKDCVPKIPSHHAVVVFANHPSWWDPLIATLLNWQVLEGRTAYTPMDQRALDRYPVFRKLGYYGVDLESLHGAKQFLAVTRTLLESPESAIWMTPGGRFADPRSHIAFQPGLSHLTCSMKNVSLVPMALEYPFWEERTPEALIEFGDALSADAHSWSKAEWQHHLESALAEAQTRLAEKAIRRDPGQFVSLVEGSAGVGGIYDLFRRVRANLSGRRFDPRHASSHQEAPS